MRSKSSRPFGGYHRSKRPGPDPILTEVGPGTPCGEYLRRYWQPVALASDVIDVPKRIRIMCEDLALFCDKSERLGLLHLNCIHRGASLEYGIPQERGIRCCYHGWTYDIDGTCLVTPGEPLDSTLRESVFQGAYPVREFGGLIFAYMGPPEEEPVFPLYDTLAFPEDNHLVPYVFEYPCNWLQSHENGVDLSHLVFLHTLVTEAQFSSDFGELPLSEYLETPIGMLGVAMRRVGDKLWLRGSDTILPNSHQFSGVQGAELTRYTHYAWCTRWCVPIDDENNITIGIRMFNDWVDPDHEGDPEQLGRNKTDLFGQLPDRPYYERQKLPGDFEAITGMGPIAVHDAEYHGTTDRGVRMLRDLIREGIHEVDSGKERRKALRADANGVIPTYNVEVIHPIPKRNDIDDDQLIREVGKKVLDITLDSDNAPPATRQDAIRERICDAYPV